MAFHKSKVQAQSQRVVSVSLSFRLLALKSWTSHRLDEEKSETTSATSRATLHVSRQWRLQRPLLLSVSASLFQYVSVTENEDIQPKIDKAQLGDGNEEGDKETAIGADHNISVQS